MMSTRLLIALALAAPLGACGGFDVGKPGPAVAKADPQLTAPPVELKNGTALEAARRR